MEWEEIMKQYHIPDHPHFDTTNTTHQHNHTVRIPGCPNQTDWNETLDTRRVALDVVVVGTLCVVGFIGNMLTIAVLRRDRERSNNSTTWLLQSLAAVDTFYLITCLLVQTLKTLVEATDWLHPWFNSIFPYMEPYIWPLAATAQTMTVWMVVLVTVDRYVAICKPFNPQIRSISKIQIYVSLIILASIVYNIPILFERQIHYNSCKDQMEVVTISSDLYYIVYKVICYLIFRSAGPLVILLLLNYRLIQALKITNVRRKNLRATSNKKSGGQSGSKHSEGITRMLVVVVSVFIVCNIPDLALRSAVILINDRYLNDSSLRFANIVTNALLTLNSAVNFLIYCLVGKKFRRILIYQMCFGVYVPGGSHSGSTTGADEFRMKAQKISGRIERGGDRALRLELNAPLARVTAATSMGVDDEGIELRDKEPEQL